MKDLECDGTYPFSGDDRPECRECVAAVLLAFLVMDPCARRLGDFWMCLSALGLIQRGDLILRQRLAHALGQDDRGDVRIGTDRRRVVVGLSAGVSELARRERRLL
jgi:hypothetical protein